MTNGYKILWTEFAVNELKSTIDFLEKNWTERELRNLSFELDKTLSLISHNPYLFQVSEIKKDVRRVVVAKRNTMYY